MCHRSGAGPKGCPVKSLTLQKLVDALQVMRDPQTLKNAQALSIKMQTENGTQAGVSSFYRNLPLHKMVCDVSIFDNQQSRVASVFCVHCGLKMCAAVDTIIHRKGSGREQHGRVPYKTKLWGRNIKKLIKSQINDTKVHKKNNVSDNNAAINNAALNAAASNTVTAPVTATESTDAANSNCFNRCTCFGLRKLETRNF